MSGRAKHLRRKQETRPRLDRCTWGRIRLLAWEKPLAARAYTGAWGRRVRADYASAAPSISPYSASSCSRASSACR